MIVRVCNIQLTPPTVPGHSKGMLQACLTSLAVNVTKSKEVLWKADSPEGALTTVVHIQMVKLIKLCLVN